MTRRDARRRGAFGACDTSRGAGDTSRGAGDTSRRAGGSGSGAVGLRLVRLLAAAIVVLAVLPGQVAAADVAFGTPTASSTFLQGVRFSEPVSLGAAVDRAEILLTFPGSSGPFVVEVPPPSGTGEATLTYTLDTSAGSSLAPNTTVTARWRVRLAGAHDPLPAGPPVSVTYADTRVSWQTAQGGVVRVHWYQGDAAFGQRALSTARDAISTAEAALGVTETAPIDFFVYADQAAFRDAIGASTGEFTVGRAIPEIRTLFGLIQPGDSGGGIDVTITHELTHIVFDTATRNPYHTPPAWLNEGVAYYLSEGLTAEYRGFLQAAVSDGTLYPLVGLVQVDLPGEKTFIGVAEQDAAVDYLVRTYGRPALAKLVDSYAIGRTDDEAFRYAIGKDVATFQADWFRSIGAKVPAAVGPSPAPAGPVPAGWGSGSGAVGPGASGVPASNPPEQHANGTPGGSETPRAVLGVAIVALAALLAVAVLVRTRRRPPAAVAPSWPGAAERGSLPTSAVPPSWPTGSSGADERRFDDGWGRAPFDRGAAAGAPQEAAGDDDGLGADDRAPSADDLAPPR